MTGNKKNVDLQFEPHVVPREAMPTAGDHVDFAEIASGTLASGRAAIARYARLAPASAGVYRMIGADGDVLYVGKAKNIKKRVLAYVRPNAYDSRVARMVAATHTLEFVSTRSETEALLLEANLIKRLRPRFNVLLRDDKSFPYILITREHRAPQILKHRGARTHVGDYFGPFASVWAVNRTITALERAFLLRSCSDSVYDARTRPCLLHQIKRCAAPCTGEISNDDYAVLVEEARVFLSGRSQAVKQQLAAHMEKAAQALDFERAAIYRDRLAALAAIQTQQGINPRGVEEADVFAIHQAGGFNCIEIFFFRTGQNWGNRAFFPKADRSLGPEEVLGSFLAQFYDDKPCPRLLLLSENIPDRDLLTRALSQKSSHKIEISTPRRGEKHALVAHAHANAREALGRRLAETASQEKLLAALAATFGLETVPRRIEVFDNSHIQGSNAVGAMIVAGPDGLQKGQYRKFNIGKSAHAPGDDYAMMREMLMRRFNRLLKEAPAAAALALGQDESRCADGAGAVEAGEADADDDDGNEVEQAWPNLVIVDGGAGQFTAAREILRALGLAQIPVIAIAKGPDRDAGREVFHLAGHTPFRLPPRDPVLYFVQRLRDEAHRFAIGSHRQRRSRDLREGGLDEIPGIGPARKRALLHHFGTLKAIERASLADLAKVSGISAETAQKIYEYFHAGGA